MRGMNTTQQISLQTSYQKIEFDMIEKEMTGGVQNLRKSILFVSDPS